MLTRLSRLLTLTWLVVALVGCGAAAPTAVPPYARYAAADVWAALGAAKLPVSNWRANPLVAGSLVPNTYAEDQDFTIGDGKQGGGQVFTFATPANQAAVRQWFAATPAFSPYVYERGNAMLWISGYVPAAEAARYAAALAAMP